MSGLCVCFHVHQVLFSTLFGEKSTATAICLVCPTFMSAKKRFDEMKSFKGWPFFMWIITMRLMLYFHQRVTTLKSKLCLRFRSISHLFLYFYWVNKKPGKCFSLVIATSSFGSAFKRFEVVSTQTTVCPLT